jgi:hypothetical protein
MTLHDLFTQLGAALYDGVDPNATVLLEADGNGQLLILDANCVRLDRRGEDGLQAVMVSSEPY